MSCQICNSEDIKILYALKRNPGYNIAKCNKCLVEYLDPLPSEEDLKNIYSAEYYKSWGFTQTGDNQHVHKMKLSTFTNYLRIFKKFKDSGKILDLGCAAGYFLEAAVNEGFDPYGIEISEYSSQLAKKNFGNEKIYNGQLKDAKFPEGSFDVISMLDFLEHIKKPLEHFEECSRILNKNGMMLIATPDTNSLSAKIQKESWTQYKFEHLFYFNYNSIKYLADKFNFKILYIKPATKTINISYLWTQSQVYTDPIFTRLLNIANKILPNFVLRKHIKISLGEMLVILQKM